MKSRTKSIKQNLTILQPPKPRKKSESRNQSQKLKQPSTQSTSVSFVKPPMPPKSNNHNQNQKQTQQAKKYLQKTLNILSHRFNIMSVQNKIGQQNVLGLSSSVYKLVKDNFGMGKNYDDNSNKENVSMINGVVVNRQYHSKIKDEIIKDHVTKNNNKESRKVIMSEKEPQQKPRSTSAMANSSSILQASSICHNQSVLNIIHPPPPNDNSIFVKRRSNSTLDSYFREKFGSNAEDEQAVEKKLRVIKALKKSQEIVTKSNRSYAGQSSLMLAGCEVNDKSIVMEKLRGKREERVR